MTTLEVTAVRSVSGEQAVRLRRVLSAARELAGEGGYPAVAIQEVANRSGVARATIYRYFSSKDHLLAAVFAEWAVEMTDTFRRDPPQGPTPADRVGALFDRVVDAALAEPGLTSAVVHAGVSGDPGAWRSEPTLARLMDDYLDAAIGDEVIAVDRRDIATVLGHVLFSALVAMTSHGMSTDDVRSLLRTAAGVVLR